MAAAEQMRRLHPDPPTRHDDYQQAVSDALLWRLDHDDYQRAEQPDPGQDISQGAALLARADAVIAALLRYGTPGDPS